MQIKRFFRFKGFVLCFFILFMFHIQVFAQDKAREQTCEEMAADIIKLKGILKNSCQDVANLMSDLFRSHEIYLDLEKNRAESFGIIRDLLLKKMGDFIWTRAKYEATRIELGSFRKRFNDIVMKANEAGVLAPGDIPRGDMSIGRFAIKGGGGYGSGIMEDIKASRGDYHHGTAKYFYYEENPASRKKKAETIEKLKEDYDRLVEDWNRAREDFYKWFEDPQGDFQTLLKSMDRKKKEQEGIFKKYNESADKLGKLAYSGDYEHCLGKIEPARSRPTSDGITGPLYIKGEPNTVDALPGMGCIFPKMAEYPDIKRPAIPDFPEKIYFKLDAVRFLEFERDLLEIKIAAEEEEIARFGGKLGKFLFETAYTATEGFAAPAELLKYLVTHPIDSAEKGARAIVWVAGLQKDLMLGTVATLIDPKGFLKAHGEDLKAIPEVTLKTLDQVAIKFGGKIDALMALGKEVASYGDPFKAPAKETLTEEIARLDKKLEATRKVREGVETLGEVAGLAIQLTGLVEEATAGVAGRFIGTPLKKGAISLFDKGKELITGADKLIDAEKAVARAGVLEKELKAGTKVTDVTAQKVEQAVAGKPLPASEITQTLKFADDAGKTLDIPVGKKLGSGATSDVFEFGADSGKVVRLTELTGETAKKAQALDKFGKEVIDDLNSSVIRSAKVDKTVEVVNEHGVKVQVQIVEKVKPAEAWLAEQGGRLTEGQGLALEQATREINAKGYAWIDNHVKNYAFEKLPGEDRWAVVVHDTGGIYPMKGATIAERAENARNLQNVIVKTEKELMTLDIKNPTMYSTAVRSEVYRVAGDPAKGVDLVKVNLKEAEQIGIGAGPGMRPDMSDLIKKTDDEIKKSLGLPEKEIANDLARVKENLIIKAEEQLGTNKKLQEIIKKPVDEANKTLDDALKRVNEPVEKPFEGKRTGVVDKIVAKDRDGKEVTLELGSQLGKGGTTTASINAANDAEVIKVISLDKPEQIVQHNLNNYGAKAIKEIKSDVIDIASVKGTYYVEDPIFGKQAVEVVERVKNTAKNIVESQGGKFTSGQQLAFEKAMRDLNNSGYAWLDNHFENYTFVKLPGEDRWKVVVIDPGNIVKMKGNTLEEMAREARNVQTRINNINLKDSDQIKEALQKAFRENNKDEVKRLQEAMEEYDRTRKEILGSVDLKAMNLAEKDVEYIGFAVKGGVRPGVGDMARYTDKELATLLTKKSDEVFKSLYGKSSEEFFKSLDQEVTNKILNDTQYRKLLDDYESGKKQLEELTRAVEAKVSEAEKSASKMGVQKGASPADEAATEKARAASMDNTRLAENLLDREKCASIRIAILGGSKDEAILNGWKKCVDMGLFQ